MTSDGGTPANGDSDSIRPATMSADGRYVAFDSEATNLAPHPTRGDVYVHDTVTGQTTRVPSGAQPNHESGSHAISADGRHVAFWTSASNMVPSDSDAADDLFVADLDG